MKKISSVGGRSDKLFGSRFACFGNKIFSLFQNANAKKVDLLTLESSRLPWVGDRVVLKIFSDFSFLLLLFQTMEKAIKLLARYFIPYINGCLLALYPYEKCCRPFYHTSYTLELYVSICLKR